LATARTGNGGHDSGVKKVGAAGGQQHVYTLMLSPDAASLPSSLRQPGTKLRPDLAVSPVELSGRRGQSHFVFHDALLELPGISIVTGFLQPRQ
jgi:hypothetical protein